MQRGPSVPPLRVRQPGQEEQAAWDRFVATQCSGNLLQTWGWGELRRDFGWKILRLVAERPDQIGWAGVLQVIHRRIAPGGLSWAYAPRGPALPDADQGTAAALLAAARAVLRRGGVIALRLDPEWPAGGGGDALRRRLRLRPAGYDIQHRNTWLLPLRGSAEEVLYRLPASTRRNIRLAQRAGIEVEDSVDPRSIDTFFRLHLETARRQGFRARSLDYYQSVVQTVGARVFVAGRRADPESAAIALTCGPRLIYLYGGSLPSPDRAPYALHWHIIGWGLARGCSTYDLWGVPRRFEAGDDQPGYAVFKTRWGGHIATHSGLLEAPWLGPLDRLVSVAERRVLARRPLLT